MAGARVDDVRRRLIQRRVAHANPALEPRLSKARVALLLGRLRVVDGVGLLVARLEDAELAAALVADEIRPAKPVVHQLGPSAPVERRGSAPHDLGGEGIGGAHHQLHPWHVSLRGEDESGSPARCAVGRVARRRRIRRQGGHHAKGAAALRTDTAHINLLWVKRKGTEPECLRLCELGRMQKTNAEAPGIDDSQWRGHGEGKARY